MSALVNTPLDDVALLSWAATHDLVRTKIQPWHELPWAAWCSCGDESRGTDRLGAWDAWVGHKQAAQIAGLLATSMRENVR